MQEDKIATVDPYLTAVTQYLQPILLVQPSVPQLLYLFTCTWKCIFPLFNHVDHPQQQKFLRRSLQDEIEALTEAIRAGK